MTRPNLLSLDAAKDRVAQGAYPGRQDTVGLSNALGRVLSEDIAAQRDQPPASLSAMDGYAVAQTGLCRGSSLRVVGTSAGGAPFSGQVSSGEAVRIYTGALLPSGADRIVMQEDCRREGDSVTLIVDPSERNYVRPPGQDFRQGSVVLTRGTVLGPGHLALAAAANHDELPVWQRPRVTVLSSGDELVPPGRSDLRPFQTIDAASYGVAALFEAWGGAVTRGAILPDEEEEARAIIGEAIADADLVVPIGGASVGDRDVVRDACAAAGAELAFAGVAVRPGKPFWFASDGKARIAGLPGNPASALVTARLLAVPLLSSLAGRGREAAEEATQRRLAAALPDPGSRETWHRASIDDAGAVVPDRREDSAMLAPFGAATHLIRQRAGSAMREGDLVDALSLLPTG